MFLFFFLMIRRPPRATRTDTLLPDTTLFRSPSNGLLLIESCLFNVQFMSLEAPCGAWPLDGALGVRIEAPGTFARPHFWDSPRSEEHTSELQSLMRNSYAVFCLKKNR